MPFTPGYGETLIADDELEALLPGVREALGDPISKATTYDLEQEIQSALVERAMTAVLDGETAVDELLSDHFVRDLHKRLYGEIWQWAGRYRKRETNLGVAPEQIAVGLRDCLDAIKWRWDNGDYTARQLGIAAHAEAVRIHPFVDGNGRTTRLLADLVFIAAQGDGPLEVYDWDLDKAAYIALLEAIRS
jgi:fido (protein-threonine AMPylation protein)